MSISLRLKHATQRALLIFPLVLAMHAGLADAAPVLPAAVSTLDVCQDEVTGNWRYSGVVAVAGKNVLQDTVISIEYKIQNKVSAGLRGRLARRTACGRRCACHGDDDARGALFNRWSASAAGHAA
ncbi:MAG: hypothetical protein H7176_11390 [Bdellovibrionales bacterium]|nr:hypothetical protein [Massilia sp.]